jgi:hypothetical protein
VRKTRNQRPEREKRKITKEVRSRQLKVEKVKPPKSLIPTPG